MDGDPEGGAGCSLQAMRMHRKIGATRDAQATPLVPM